MSIDTAPVATGTVLGYARVSTRHQSLDQQVDALTAAGVDPARVYSDKLSGTSTREQQPGLAALLDYARQGDAIVVVGIDRLGRNAAEVMTTVRELGERGIVVRSLREGIDTVLETCSMDAQPKVERWEKHAEWPLAALAMIFLAVYSVDVLVQPHGDAADALSWFTRISYVVFAVDYVARLSLASHRPHWVLRHLFDLAVVTLPLLRPLRLLRLVVLIGALQKAAPSQGRCCSST
jgi:hypothetical protein